MKPGDPRDQAAPISSVFLYTEVEATDERIDMMELSVHQRVSFSGRGDGGLVFHSHLAMLGLEARNSIYVFYLRFLYFVCWYL
jgi:predicted phosphoadenosine phosphosulfate sulfurtransferase